MQIFTQSLGECMLEVLNGQYESHRQEKKEHALYLFAFIAEVFVILEDYI